MGEGGSTAATAAHVRAFSSTPSVWGSNKNPQYPLKDIAESKIEFIPELYRYLWVKKNIYAIRGWTLFICQQGLCWFFFFARFAKSDYESSDEAHEDESDGDESYRFLID